MSSQYGLNNKAMHGVKPLRRLEKLGGFGAAVAIRRDVPIESYYRCGPEMIKSANDFIKANLLENAFVLYIKYLSLFHDAIRTHPGYNACPANLQQKVVKSTPEVKRAVMQIRDVLSKRFQAEYEANQIAEKEGNTLPAARAVSPVAPTKAYRSPVVDDNEAVYWIRKAQQEEERQQSARKRANALIDQMADPTGKLDLMQLDVGAVLSMMPADPAKLLLPEVALYQTLQPPERPKDLLHAVVVPSDTIKSFMSEVKANTDNNIETIGIFAGLTDDNTHRMIITHIVIPRQKGSSDMCEVTRYEDLAHFFDENPNHTRMGWIHTHPRHELFLSSVDVHTHQQYQQDRAESFAVVCAPRCKPNFAIFRMTPRGMEVVRQCDLSGFHQHPAGSPLFEKAKGIKSDEERRIDIVDYRHLGDYDL